MRTGNHPLTSSPDLIIKDMGKESEYASKIMELAQDTIMVRYRFFDSALYKITIKQDAGIPGYSFDGINLFYNPVKLLKDYVDEPNIAVRLLLHVLFHGLFMHIFALGISLPKEDEDLWDTACDVACEEVIQKLDMPDAYMKDDAFKAQEISNIRRLLGGKNITAQRVFLLLKKAKAEDWYGERLSSYNTLFRMDDHSPWHNKDEEAGEEILLLEEDWKRISGSVKSEISNFYDEKPDESFLDNLMEALRDKKKYNDILKRFSIVTEQMRVSPDEFDYVYYMHGLSTYKNMPLIEMLEYTEEKRIREFAVVIDTSASCSGELVKNFMIRTYEILCNENLMATNINIHIICADSDVRSDVKITCREELDDYASKFVPKGFGATDFRPAFSYVDDLIAKKEFDDLKGLIYFTDGYGVYPSKCPKYEVIFAYTGYDEMRPKTPDWAIEAVFEEGLIS